MTRSKDHVSADHHDKHVSRNGQTTALKKMGAGVGNWGVLGDEIPDVEEYVHTHNEPIATAPVSDKVNIVDANTFNKLRKE